MNEQVERNPVVLEAEKLVYELYPEDDIETILKVIKDRNEEFKFIVAGVLQAKNNGYETSQQLHEDDKIGMDRILKKMNQSSSDFSSEL